MFKNINFDVSRRTSDDDYENIPNFNQIWNMQKYIINNDDSIKLDNNSKINPLTSSLISKNTDIERPIKTPNFGSVDILYKKENNTNK